MRIGLTTKGVIASVSFTQAFENAFTRVLFVMAYLELQILANGP